MSKKINIKWIFIVTLIILIIISPLFYISGNKYPIKEIKVNSTESITLDIAYLKKWDEKEIYEQFSSYKDYYSTSKSLTADYIGDFIEESKLKGIDEYNPEVNHGTFAEVYEIKGINKDCAVALKFASYDDFYVYVNSNYKPETLGEFIEDLNLMENVSFGTIYYDYVENDNYRLFEFNGITNDDVWNYLFKDNLECENRSSDINSYKHLMAISTNVDILGFNNISLCVTEDGYIYTNILATRKAFYIGEEKVKSFMEFVKNVLEGYEHVIVYIEDEMPVVESDDISTESTIVQYNVETGEETIIEIDITDSPATGESTESYNPNS